MENPLGERAACALISILVVACLMGAPSPVGGVDLVQLDGSGTSNPAPLVWKYMEAFMAHAKPAIAMTYRSIGTGNGITEFLGNLSGVPAPTSPLPVNNFAMGDVPISSVNWAALNASDAAALHVPLLVGTVSFYHNVQGLGTGLSGINLSPCTLAGIFSGAITTWGDAAIVADNPDNTLVGLLLASKPAIVVLHRTNGSSSTWGISHYFEAACPASWPAATLLVGFNTPGWPGRSVANSQAMAAAVLTTAYSIGYVESGQGASNGLKEINIQNKAGNWVNTANATAVNTTVLLSVLPLSLGDARWSDVSLIYLDGATQWPISLISYYFIRQDSSFLGDAGGLLKMFVNYTLSDAVAAVLPTFGFLALPASLRTTFRAALGVEMLTAGETWIYENATQVTVGQGNYVISENRDTYVDRTVQALALQAITTASTLTLGNAYQVHGSGLAVPQLYLRYIMDLLVDRSRLPIVMTYRAIDTLEAQAEMLSTSAMYTGYNHFKVGDVPLSPLQYGTLSALAAGGTGVAQVPFAVGSVSVFYNQAVPFLGVQMDACLLKRIYSGNITTWSDADLSAYNAWDAAGFLATSPLLNVGITVFAYASPNSATQTLFNFLNKACPTFGFLSVLTAADPERLGTLIGWPGVAVSYAYLKLPILTPADMVAAIAGTLHSVGYVQSAVGLAANLSEVQLKNAFGDHVTSTFATTSLTSAVLAANLPSSITADHSSVSLAFLAGQDGKQGETTFPMVTLQYFYVYTNLVPYGQSGPLLVAFLNFTLSPEGQSLVTAMGLTPLPTVTLAGLLDQLPLGDVFNVASLLQEWVMEQPNQFSDLGMGLYTFSGNRESYSDMHNAAVDASLAQITSEAVPTVLRMVGPEDLSFILSLALNAYAEYATAPVSITFETLLPSAVVATQPSPIATMLMPATPGVPGSAPAQMLLANQPLTGPEQTYLMQNGLQFLSLPVLVRPVALSYRGNAGLHFTACTLYGILAGTVKLWNDPLVVADNPGFALPANQIVLLYTTKAGGDVIATTQYAYTACTTRVGLIDLGTKPVNTAPTVALMTANAPAYTYLAIVPPSYSDQDGLQQASLQQAGALRGTTASLTSQSTAATDYSAMLETAIGTGTGVPSDPLLDWSSFTLAGQTKSPVYPLVRVDYLIVPADLTRFGSTGGAMQGMFDFLTTYFQLQSVTSFGAYFSPMGTIAQGYATNTVLPRMVRAAAEPAWPLVHNSTEVTTGDLPIVLNRYALSDVVLSLAATSSYLTSTLANSLASAPTTDQVAQICSALISSTIPAEMQRRIDVVSNQADAANAKADAAIVLAVLAVVVALVSLAALLVTLWRSNRPTGAGDRYRASGSDLQTVSTAQMTAFRGT